MSCFGFSPLILHWMLDFSLAPRLQFASAQKQSVQTAFSPHFWLVLVGWLDVQSMHTCLQKSNFGLAVRLKFQIACYVC
jgi:hypothetical protein